MLTDDRAQRDLQAMTIENLKAIILRLKMENADMREIVRWAARQGPHVYEIEYEKAQCPGCGASFNVLGEYAWDAEVAALEHAPDCPVIKARALLDVEARNGK